MAEPCPAAMRRIAVAEDLDVGGIKLEIARLYRLPAIPYTESGDRYGLPRV